MVAKGLANEVAAVLSAHNEAAHRKAVAAAEMDSLEYDLRSYCLNNSSLRHCIKLDMAQLRRTVSESVVR